MKRYLPVVIVAAVALIAIGGGMALYRAKRLPVLTAPKEASSPPGKAGEPIRSRGPADAPVTLEEFGDFQCPPCGRFSEPINDMARDYKDKLRIVFREMPLPMHQHARLAAEAAEAAGLQDKFWQMHDLIYREQAQWSNATDARVVFNSYAGVLGLDLARFNKDMSGPQVQERLALDAARAKELGVTNTPTIFVNGTQVAGTSLNPGGVRAAIDAALTPKPQK
jgi:protein-disulfide isomerase